jgi:hypothetical protein
MAAWAAWIWAGQRSRTVGGGFGAKSWHQCVAEVDVGGISVCQGHRQLDRMRESATELGKLRRKLQSTFQPSATIDHGSAAGPKQVSDVPFAEFLAWPALGRS